LAELKGLGTAIPNQALLVDSLILQEAKASSEIENIVTASDALFRAFTAKTKQNRQGNALSERGSIRTAVKITCR